MSEFSNTPGDRVSRSGGAVQVALSSNEGQGNGGTSLPCRVCFVSSVPGNTKYVTVKVVTSTTISVGCVLPCGATDSVISPPLELKIDDVSKLFFYSEDADALVNITYLR